MNFREEAYLMHYGILGMKWGKRNLRNSDGTLSDSSKNKLSKQYKKLATKATNAVGKKSQKLYIDAYNKTAEEYNNGKIAEFNKKNNQNSKDYYAKYEKQFNKDLSEKYNKMVTSEIKKNKNFKKAQALVEKYNMTSFDVLAKQNAIDLKKNGG